MSEIVRKLRCLEYPTKAQVEIMAAACCYAGFLTEQKRTPLGYWRTVADDQKEFYRKQARALIDLVRAMPTVRKP